MVCPLHEDNKRSASLNVLTGAFYCQAEDIGMGIQDLLKLRSEWIPPSPDAASQNGHARRSGTRSSAPEVITEGRISGWQSALMSSDEPLDELIARRGLHEETLERFQIGWDPDRQAYTVPVRGPDRELWNVRYYTFDPNADTKIWSTRGMRVTELYPMSILESDPEDIIICEGEWDTLLTIQNGYHAITKTSGAKTWNTGWNVYFKDRRVWLAHDADFDGQAANRKVGRSLMPIVKELRVIELPYPIEPKHGKDLTDFWLEHDRADFEQLLYTARVPGKKDEKQVQTITVLDSFDAQKVGDPVQLEVTIKGKKDPGYSVPKRVQLNCSRDRGPQCNYCPLKPAGGEVKVEIAPANPAVLGMLDTGTGKMMEMIAGDYGVPGAKCPKLTIEVEEHQAVEELFARPSIDHGLEQSFGQEDGPNAGAYKNIKITSVGRHDTMPNNTLLVTGALYPNPRSQKNEFLAWEIERRETSIDRFEITPEAIKLMKRFQPRKGQRPLRKLSEIDRELARHVTRIVGRPEMHALMDLTWHSLLAFRFAGTIETRGWIQSIIIGDTRTGKSAAANALLRHFGAGERVAGESASLAGLIGGLQQMNGKDWAVTWGVIPLNDQRMVVVDEFPHPDDISKMSDTLSSGVAKLTKIQQDVTHARTRTLWMGNPPATEMSNYTYGVDSFRAIIHTPEDIARFDLAMAVTFGDVPSEEINKPVRGGELRYTAEACHTMLMWCWTRKPTQVIWSKGAEDTVFKLANEMGKRYTEQPPLVQAANIRIKIARVAVALAARTFSTDETHENVIVTKEHVQDAVTFMDLLYGLPSFGYAERSRERLLDIAEAEENREEIRRYLLERRGLAKFLRGVGRFRRQDLEEIMNADRDTANAVINKLWTSRMIRKDGQDIRIEPTLHSLLREVRW